MSLSTSPPAPGHGHYGSLQHYHHYYHHHMHRSHYFPHFPLGGPEGYFPHNNNTSSNNSSSGGLLWSAPPGLSSTASTASSGSSSTEIGVCSSDGVSGGSCVSRNTSPNTTLSTAGRDNSYSSSNSSESPLSNTSGSCNTHFHSTPKSEDESASFKVQRGSSSHHSLSYSHLAVYNSATAGCPLPSFLKSPQGNGLKKYEFRTIFGDFQVIRLL